MIMNRVEQKLRQLTIYRSLPLTVEFRMGYAVSHDPPERVDDFLRLADQDLQGKRSRKIK
jgi:hypothetical protein